MKLKFKQQAFQTEAVNAVAACFDGQPRISGLKYRIDPGKEKAADHPYPKQIPIDAGFAQSGFKNHDLMLTSQQMLENIHAVQQTKNLALSPKLATSKALRCKPGCGDGDRNG